MRVWSCNGKETPYYQYFCGFHEFQVGLPCQETELVKFRQRIGKEGMEKIFNMSVGLHGKAAEEKQVIVGVAAHSVNEHDSKTLDAALTSASSNRTKKIEEAICNRGYIGIKEVKGITISIPEKELKRDTKYQKEKKREKFRRRAAIEPVIGHLKSDHRMQRNYLKGFIGDEMNLLMAASAFNCKKWMNVFIQALFAVNIAVTIAALARLRPVQRADYADLALILWRLR